MVEAGNDHAHQSLTAQFVDHGRTGPMRRGYMAFIWDAPGHRTAWSARLPIDRHVYAREKMAVREGGREAVTHWELLASYNGRDGKPVASLLACQLETGRTHQIRVHLSHIDRPLMSDAVYGSHFKTKAGHLRISRPSAALSAQGRQAPTPTCWLWSTPGPRAFCALGGGFAGGFASLAGRFWKRRYDAGLLEKQATSTGYGRHTGTWTSAILL